jgi:hypothetical protein
MTTQAQLDANRQNAQKSTGPKTPDGKDKVAKNALKHGLLARRFFIGPEQQDAFDKFRSNVRDDLNPVGPVQSTLADRIADLAWRLTQCRDTHTSVLNALIGNKPRFSNAYRPDNFETLREVEDYLLASTTIADFTGSTILDRLAAYEHRIERGLYAAQKEFRALRTFRAKEDILKAKQMDYPDPEYGPFYNRLVPISTPAAPAMTADPAPRTPEAPAEQTNPIAPNQFHVTNFKERTYSYNQPMTEDKTNPSRPQPDPARPTFESNTAPFRTPTPGHPDSAVKK